MRVKVRALVTVRATQGVVYPGIPGLLQLTYTVGSLRQKNIVLKILLARRRVVTCLVRSAGEQKLAV